MTKEEILKKVEIELDRCNNFLVEKVAKMSEAELANPNMSALDFVHEACHHLTVYQADGRGPFPTISELREMNKEVKK
jgi:hypothetical protein